MANTQMLVIKRGYDFSKWLLQHTGKFPKSYRFSVAAKLENGDSQIRRGEWPFALPGNRVFLYGDIASRNGPKFLYRTLSPRRRLYIQGKNF